MSGGAALVAFAMMAASDLVPLTMRWWLGLGASFIWSCAMAVMAASMDTEASEAAIVRMMISC
jgi:hypothetical protein